MNTGFDGNRAYNFLQKINFQRFGGTANEKKAAEIIKNEFKSFGLDARFQEFKIATSYNFHSECRVVKPYHKDIEISHRVISGVTPIEGVEAEFKYIESAGERYCADIKNKIVMMVGRLDRYVYERLKRHGALAVLIPMNYNQDLYTVGYDVDFVKKFGPLPICFISYADALDLMKSNARTLYLKLEDEVDFEGTGVNVIAEIKGTVKPDEEILFVGHYDTVLCNGLYDNAAGTATVLEMARHYQQHHPIRTAKFILFSGEELGLRGSRAFIEKIKNDNDALKRKKMVFNFDLGGTILGRNCVRVTGSDEMYHYIDALNKIEDWDFLIEKDTYSSDNMPFALEGIPSINFFRTSLGLGHALNDTIDHISAEAFEMIGKFAIQLTSGIINAPMLPFKRKISSDIEKKVKHFFDITSPEEPEENE